MTAMTARPARTVTRRSPVWITGIAAAVCLGSLVTGCGAGEGGDGGSTTCSEFAAMSKDNGLGSNFTDQQTATLKKMLDDEDLDTSQVPLAGMQVIAYCNIYGGAAGSNPDAPISNIPGMQGN